MAIDAFEPYGPIADNRIQIGGGRKPAQAPFFLIPPPPDNPAAIRILRRISFNRGLCLGEAVGCRKIEGQLLEAKSHHMTMRVD